MIDENGNSTISTGMDGDAHFARDSRGGNVRVLGGVVTIEVGSASIQLSESDAWKVRDLLGYALAPAACT